MSSGIGRQQRPRSACVSAQSDQGFHCPLTELLETKKVSTEDKCPDETAHARDESDSVHFAHARNVFACRCSYCCISVHVFICLYTIN